jgi:S-ribosylhomocysteine lyase LuxS involved in autoinducer biosynthesis
MKVIVLLANGFEEVEALTPVDVLRRAGAEVRTLSIHKEEKVTGAHAVTVMADGVFTGAIQLTKDAMDFIANYNEEIPGTKKEECGNYKEHDLQGARAIAKDMQTVLADWTEQDLAYPEAPEGTFV